MHSVITESAHDPRESREHHVHVHGVPVPEVVQHPHGGEGRRPPYAPPGVLVAICLAHVHEVERPGGVHPLVRLGLHQQGRVVVYVYHLVRHVVVNERVSQPCQLDVRQPDVREGRDDEAGVG